MQKPRNIWMFKFLLVLCLSFTLLLSQTDRLHVHLVHDDTMSSECALCAHVADVHPESTLHSFDLTNHHDNQNDHSANAMSLAKDKLLKKSNLVDPLAFILLFIVVLLSRHLLGIVPKQALSNAPFRSHFYLLQPPLRAPPIK